MDDVEIEDPTELTPSLLNSDPGEQRELKLVSSVIRPESLEAVKMALNGLELVGGMTITDVRGFGRQKGQVEHYRGGTYQIRFVPKIKVEIAVRDQDVEAVMTAIGRAAHTGQVGDGKIFVLDLANVIRIRTGDHGAVAL